MRREIIYEDEQIQWIVICRDHEKPNDVIDTNEYVVVSNGEALILDPGGIEIFPHVLTTMSEVIDLKNIKGYLCSHQDPDIMSSLPLWLGLTPDARVYLSWLWSGFVAHFGHEYTSNFVNLPDEGEAVTLGQNSFDFIPAHFCHSPGNFHFWDSTSQILFSGDMGAALLPNNYPVFVENFEQHIRYMEAFHVRWMPSNQAKKRWIERVRKLKPKMLCPQHGAIFRGDDVGRFLEWLDDLEVGKVRSHRITT